MHTRTHTGLTSSPLNFFQASPRSDNNLMKRDDRQSAIIAHSIENESSPELESIVIKKIRDYTATLADKVVCATTPEELVTAMSEWDQALDILGQSIPDNNELRKKFTVEIESALMADKREKFHVTIRGQNHITNRVRLLMEHGDKIRKLHGHDSTTGLIAIGIVIVQTLLASLVSDLSWPNFLLAMILIGSVLNHSAGMIIHEASHNLTAPTPTLNRLVSIAANLPFGIPHQASFERYHLQHHYFLGQPDRDNDLPPPVLARWVGNSSVKKALWLAFYPLAYAVTQKPEKPTWKQIANVLVQLGWDAGIVKFLGPWALTYMIGSTLIGFSALNPVSAHWIDEHFLRDEDGQETHSYYGWLNWLNWYVGFHNEHHDFPGIPGRRLPELHRIASDFYGKQRGGNSWLNSIWQFITDPNISAHSRIIRTAQTQHKSNAALVAAKNKNEIFDDLTSVLQTKQC